MKVELHIEIYAIAVGVEGETGVGRVSHKLEVVTETDHLYLPITANILCKQIILNKCKISSISQT